MTVHVQVDDDAVVMRFSGADAVYTLRRSLRVPLATVTSARVAPVEEARRLLGLRIAGGYWPGLLATGRFLVRGHRGERQFWCVYRDPEVLLIETSEPRLRRVVIQHPDRHDLAWFIGERIAR